ncbi:MAG: PSD1 and planctomycete cytochrome C domain-containing protein [Verrucomicrobiota bacterium]
MKTHLPFLTVLLSAGTVSAAEPTADQTEFFETKIRPLLVESCYKCHSTEAGKDKGGLLLDTRDALRKGGDTGPAIVPGEPAKSLLIKAIRREDPDTAMPPKGKGEGLTKEQIENFETWIKGGAFDPRTGTVAKSVIQGLMEQAKTHWAFQPLPRTPVAVGASGNLVDGLFPAKQAPADARTLIRRATLTLIGLPPSPERVDTFTTAYARNPEGAFAELTEELLNSPQYGERWGRHWLDVARYADNMGAIFNGDDSYPFAFTYRDWVIRSMNEDKPYDRFVMEQLAADLLPGFKPDQNASLAALGFLTLGRRTDRRVDENVYDDRIDVISRGLLGLTVGCARCHDHKLEPIPTTDYYSLFGILRSCTEPESYPVLKPQADTPESREFDKLNRVACAEYIRVHALEADRSMSAIRSRLGDYLLAARDGNYEDSYTNKKVVSDVLNPRRLNTGVYNRTVKAWDKWVKAHPELFGPWLELAALDGADFGNKAEVLCQAFGKNTDKKLHPAVARVFQKVHPKELRDIADCYNNLWAVEVDGPWAEKWRAQIVKATAPTEEELGLPTPQLETRAIDRLNTVEKEQPLPDHDAQTLRATLLSDGSPFVFTGKDFLSNKLYLNRDVAEGLRRTVSKAHTELAAHAGAPVRLMALQESVPVTSKVYIRGNPRTLGAEAPRAWFAALRTPETPVFPKEQSGRLQLAQQIASRDNPLTARVIVNRVWGWHFGEGLVKTPSDFGLRGDRPVNQELLDSLAVWFMDNGWSLKKLHRLLMSSKAWQQQQRTQPLDFEAFRDSTLAVSGGLDTRLGGKPDDLSKVSSTRRTVYALVDRKSLPNLFRNFDFPDPSSTAPQRSRTALTPQALFLLNSSFVVERARSLAKLAHPSGGTEQDATAVRSLYQLVFQRNPSEAEVQRALEYVAAYPKNDVVMPEVNDWSYGSGKFDAETQRVVGFAALKFAGDKVAGAGGMELRRDGGQPAKDGAIVRRWIAPKDGLVDIYAELAHLSKEGDGVTSRIVSSRNGLLGEWTAEHRAVQTTLNDVEVKVGDTLDFLTECRGDPKGDTFRWAPTITMPKVEMPGMAGMAMRWDAKGNFMDPSKLPAPLNAWEEFAHVLLLSNEFAVVD